MAELLTRHGEKRDVAGRLRLVRNGYLPERTIQTGLGEVPVPAPRVPRVWGRARLRFRSRGDAAAVSAPHQDAGRAVAVAVSEGPLDGRVRGVVKRAVAELAPAWPAERAQAGHR